METNQIALDQDGHLINLQDWSLKVAQQMANSLQISLTEQHITILHAMRVFYETYEHSPNTRPLIKYLQKTVDADLSSSELMQLFNSGRIAREICRLSGLPKPPNCI